MNGPWPVGAALPETLPTATTISMLQLGHMSALLGIINFFVLTAAREVRSPALQEKIASSLLSTLLVSDVTHILVTLYGLGDTRWDIDEWPSIIWITIVTGLTLLIPRFVREYYCTFPYPADFYEIQLGSVGSWELEDMSIPEMHGLTKRIENATPSPSTSIWGPSPLDIPEYETSSKIPRGRHDVYGSSGHEPHRATVFWERQYV